MLGLIVSREFTALLKSKAMRVSTAIVVALMLIGGGVAGFLLGGKGVDVSIPPATGHTAQTKPLGFIVGMVAVMFVAIPIFMGMGALNSGVVEEKTSRVVEIILTTVKPRTLLLAKLLGIGSAVLVFIACYLAGIVAGAGLAGVLPSMENLAAAHLNPWTFAPAVLVWLAVGYFTFGGLSGALASTVSRQEDLGAVQTPVIFGAMIPMYVALYLVPYAPDTTVTHILSCCPFLSAFMMPMRMALGAVGVWEQLLAFAVQIATICLLSLLAGKVYERSILHTGERLKLRQALRGR